jgi:hypothetical protein
MALLALLAWPSPAQAAVTVQRAEINSGQLRVEGTATPSRDITVDGVVLGRSASDGRFKIERSGFTPPGDCTTDVNDGSATPADLNGGVLGSLKATAKHPGVVAKAIVHNPELDEVLSAAEEILDFKTKAARDIEAARIRSIIDPRLADHVRREAVKFVDELRRTGNG